MITVDGMNISLDEREPQSDMDFISHAHSDHIMAAKKSKAVITSDETSDLIKAAYNIDIIRSDFKSKGISLLNSGHMLGAKQIKVDDPNNDKTIIYSGDYLVENNDPKNKIEIKKSDMLIVDSTYPSPSFKFDDRAETINQIKDWVERSMDKGIILFGSYSMGKPQELISILNEIGIIPVVNKKISMISKVYNKYGCGLKFKSVYDGDENLFDDNFVGIISNISLSRTKHMLSYIHHKKVMTAVTTGFSKVYNLSVDKQFDLSDHSDFYQALQYIDSSNPKEVYTYGQSQDEFALNLRKLGYNAKPFSEYRNGEILPYHKNEIKLFDNRTLAGV